MAERSLGRSLAPGSLCLEVVGVRVHMCERLSLVMCRWRPATSLPNVFVCVCERVNVKLLSRGSYKRGLLLFRERVRVR